MITCSNPTHSNRRATLGVVTLACLALLLTAVPALAESVSPIADSSRVRARGAVYKVTITNLTYDQIISPPVVVAHDARFNLFDAGQPASDELAALAEDGMTGPLAGLLEVSQGVADYAVAAGGIPPTGSVSVEIWIQGGARMLSLAGMLVSTNDTFAGLDGYAIPFGLLNSMRGLTIDAPAYDAGSEANTESCVHIPGPPCGNPGVRVTDGAEGFVHVHRGIGGIGDLDATAKDWRNPVARVTIERE